MKLRIIKIGKPATREVESLVDRYAVRLSSLGDIERIVWKEKESEAQGKVAALKSGNARLVILDERGREYSSIEFSQQLERWRSDPGVKEVNFIIGGPYGLSDETRKLADSVISLSKGTLPSDLAWLLLVEQIYRAHTILRGMAYHHE